METLLADLELNGGPDSVEKLKRLKENYFKLKRRTTDAERRLKAVQMFTNSYSSFSHSRNDLVSPFDTMMSMLEDIYDQEVKKAPKNHTPHKNPIRLSQSFQSLIQDFQSHLSLHSTLFWPL